MPDRSIPTTVADLTPGWLEATLTDAGHLDDASVSNVVATAIGTGQMCDSYRLDLELSPASAGRLSLVAKLPAENELSRSTAQLLRSYEIEVRFYQELAGQLDLHTPGLRYADIDLETADFVLLLDDLAPAVAGDQLAGCSVEDAQRAISELVGLHAPRWGDPELAEVSWLHRDPESNRAFLRMMVPTFWSSFQERYGSQLGEEVTTAADALVSGLDGYLDRDAGPWSIVHGDYRLDNLLFHPDGDRVAVVDWQTASHGPPVGDLAYFIGAGLLPEVRREVESDLVGEYHAMLVGRGVRDFGREECWRRYVEGTWAGLIMAISASMIVEQTDRGDEMFLVMAHRHAQHVHDLGAIDELVTSGG